MLKIQNANILDPLKNESFTADLYIENGKIAAVGAAPAGAEAAQVLDAAGLCLAPGLVDMHVHLREPGLTYKEDIHSGALAALYGGVTSIAAMPNTKPVVDDPAVLAQVLDRAKDAAVHVYQFAAVTLGQKSGALCDLPALQAAGAVAFSDDGLPVSDDELMRQGLIQAEALGKLVSSHCEIASMVDGRAVNEGKISEMLGIPGRPAIAEELMIQRDCDLAKETGARVHIAHVSTAKSVDIIRKAKAAGVRVSAETCPQYFSLTEDIVLEKGALARVNPPLRTQADVEGIIAGLQDGTLDAIATDHAPHAAEEKAKGLTGAPAGMIGLETSLALTLTYLYHEKKLSLPEIIRKMALNPARLLGIPAGTLDVGAAADLVLFDPEEEWVVDPARFRSKARNTPYGGAKLRGRVKYTIVDGNVTKVS